MTATKKPKTQPIRALVETHALIKKEADARGVTLSEALDHLVPMALRRRAALKKYELKR